MTRSATDRRYLLIRGRLYQKLNELANAQKDYQASYALLPTAGPPSRLGELAGIA